MIVLHLGTSVLAIVHLHIIILLILMLSTSLLCLIILNVYSQFICSATVQHCIDRKNEKQELTPFGQIYLKTRSIYFNRTVSFCYCCNRVYWSHFVIFSSFNKNLFYCTKFNQLYCGGIMPNAFWYLSCSKTRHVLASLYPFFIQLEKYFSCHHPQKLH